MAAAGIWPEEGTLTSQNLIDFFDWFFINALDAKQRSCRAVHGVVRLSEMNCPHFHSEVSPYLYKLQ